MHKLKALIILALLSFSLEAAESFFAKDFLRSIFNIELSSEEIIYTARKEKLKSLKVAENQIRILVWNIYKGDLFEEAKPPINLSEYHLLFLQEFSQQISDELLPSSHRYFLPTFKWSNKSTGVALFSEQELTKVTPLHSKYREPFILTPKSAIIAHYKDITLVNIHSLNFVMNDEWEEQIEAIRHHIKDQDRIIWAGDFNTWNESRIDFLKKTMKDEGLEQVQFQKDLRTKHMGYPIDFIFTKGIEVLSAKSFSANGSSDHTPMEITIKED